MIRMIPSHQIAPRVAEAVVVPVPGADRGVRFPWSAREIGLADIVVTILHIAPKRKSVPNSTTPLVLLSPPL